MSMEQIETALAERDEAIKETLTELETKNAKLEEKNLELGDRIVHLEQRDVNFIPDMKKAPTYSIQKVMRHLSNARDNDLNGFEGEMHQELIGKSGINRPNAVMIPLSTKTVQADLYSPDVSAGYSLVETRLHTDLIDVLREESVVLGLNPTMFDAVGDLDLPRKSSGTTAYWFGADDADTITESTPKFETVSMSPKFVAGLTKASYKMLTQTGHNIEGILMQDLMAVIADAIDLAAIQGTGASYQPTGILQQSGILSDVWSSSPQAFDWESVLEMERLMITNKSLKGNISALCDPVTYKATKNTVKSSGDSVGFLAEPDGSMNGYPLRATTNMPANTVLMGNWNDLVVVNWGTLALEVDPFTNFNSGTTGFRAIMPIDFAVRHAESFVKSSTS